VIQFLKHKCANTTTGKILDILIGHAQLSSGLPQPILEDTRPILWNTAPWLQNMQEFLHQIDGQIIINNTWTPLLCRTGDLFIMEELMKIPLKQPQYEILNNIRISLKVAMLSDIVKQNGMYIQQHCLGLPSPFPNKEEHYNTNTSTMVWPQNATPNEYGWRLWK